jgi:linoleoyl-CoA desaturase
MTIIETTEFTRTDRHAGATSDPESSVPALAEVDLRLLERELAELNLDDLARDLDDLRERIQSSLGEEDAEDLRRIIRLHRALEMGGRASLVFAVFPPAMIAGAAMLGLAKIIDNMELGHNIMHGQWDWMNDPEINSETWDWDTVCPAEHWKHSHNYMHHQWTNVDGVDLDVGYGILRVHPGQKWFPATIAQPLYFVLLAALFQHGVGAHDLGYPVEQMKKFPKGSPEYQAAAEEFRTKLGEFGSKAFRQIRKDYLLFPLLSLPFGLPGVVASAAGAGIANLIRNVWAFSVIFCGHFPDGAEYFAPEEVENESRGAWYRRQILGSVNFNGGKIMRMLSGNLCHQVEHHLFPDIPSNRYGEISVEVQEICARHGLTYNTASFSRQFGSVVRNVLRLSLPGGRSAS